jgi:2-polyprenyl-3-methyl-5-hydroxy-6-metoxy-1,4-benzoquinol methylase
LNIHEDQPVDKSRNYLIQKVMSRDLPDFIFFLDSDNVLSVEDFDKLVKTMEEEDADVVSGLYFSKQRPYLPVVREFKFGGFWNIEVLPKNKVVKVDGVGTGVCLIRPRVFRRLSFPWFQFSYERWGYKDIQLSEDLFWCRNMMREGMKVLCDTNVVSNHIGGSVGLLENSLFDKLRCDAKQDREAVIGDIVEFTGLSEEEVEMRVMVGDRWIRDEWNEKKPKTKEDRLRFYKETTNYVWDLFLWHTTKRRGFDLMLVKELKNVVKPKNILDVGCGVGINGFLLAKEGFSVTLADLDSKSLDFAVWRMKKHGLSFKVWKMDVESSPCDKFDCILLFDVVEHLSIEEFRELVDRLLPLKADGCRVFVQANFGSQDGVHPFHFDFKEEYDVLIKKLVE